MTCKYCKNSTTSICNNCLEPKEYLMKEEDKKKIIEMRKHLAELHDKWQKGVESGEDDGHCKSNEGYVGILYRMPNWFECDSDKIKYENAKPEFSMIEVYSYLFGPNRLHTFYTVDEAYNEVMSW